MEAASECLKYIKLIYQLSCSEIGFKFVTKPMLFAVVQMVASCTLNAVFAKYAYKSSITAFNMLACLCGMSRLFFVHSIDFTNFALITIAVYTLLFYTATQLKQVLEFDGEKVLKLYIVAYVMCCFSIHTIRDDLDEFVILLIVLSIKVICAYRNEDDPETVPDLLTLMSYLTYTPWISYTAFVTLRRKRHQKTKQWLFRMLLAIPKTLIFKILSSNLIPFERIKEFTTESFVYTIIRALQYRNMYYFKAQIAEMELLAVGVKQYNWQRHLTFNFKNIEFSVMAKDSMKGFSVPATDFFYNNFIVRGSDRRKVPALVHTGVLLLIIFRYSARYSALFMLFLGSLHLQETALASLQRCFDVCLYSCTTRVCVHSFGPRFLTFYYVKFIFIMSNFLRMTVLFVDPETVLSSCNFIASLILLDVMIIIGCHNIMLRRRQFEYFQYLQQY